VDTRPAVGGTTRGRSAWRAAELTPDAPPIQICARRRGLMADAAVHLASTIHELVRTHAAASPPPRGLSYLALEHASGTGFHLLDRLRARGIFRQSEFVLELGTELGARSRCHAARLRRAWVATP